MQATRFMMSKRLESLGIGIISTLILILSNALYPFPALAQTAHLNVENNCRYRIRIAVWVYRVTDGSDVAFESGWWTFAPGDKGDLVGDDDQPIVIRTGQYDTISYYAETTNGKYVWKGDPSKGGLYTSNLPNPLRLRNGKKVPYTSIPATTGKIRLSCN